jgi:hypothetical protein
MHIISILTNPAIIGTVALFLAVVWMIRDQRDKTRPLLVFALTLNLFFGFLLTVFMSREGGLLPWKFDHVLYCIDQSLGIRAAAIARPLEGFWRVPLIVVYQLMVPMMIFWFFVTRAGNPRASVVLAYVAELIAAPILYAIFPACGPIYAFGAQWLNPQAVAAGAVKLVGMPNAFPSLHVGTAFVFVLLAPGRLWRAVSLVFLAATAIATLATGEHYVIDLVAGLAFGCFAASVGYRRARNAALYLALVLAWSLTARFAYTVLIAYPALTRVLAATTVAIAAFTAYQEWTTPNVSAAKPQAVAVS